MQKINIGLIGAGRIGRIHAESLSRRVPNARLLLVTDAILASAEQCAADFQIPEVASTAQAIFQHGDIDAVAICSSTDTHVPFIIEAAQAGKHIFCEKPIALDLPSVDRALAIVGELFDRKSTKRAAAPVSDARDRYLRSSLRPPA